MTQWKEKKTTPLLDVPDENKVAAHFLKSSLPSNTCIIYEVQLGASLESKTDVTKPDQIPDTLGIW